MTEISNPAELHGKKLVDPSGGEIGQVQEIYLDHETDRPEFALVNTGLFGRKSTFVPLTGASLDGPRVWVDVDKDRVADAPKVDPEDELSAEQEAAIYHHYGISQPAPPATTTTEGGAQEPSGGDATTSGLGGVGTGPVGQDAHAASAEPTRASATTEQGATGEAASPPSGTTPQAPGEAGAEAGLPRLRRYVVTEEIDVKVPVQREEIRVEPPEARSGEDRERPDSAA